MYEAVSIISFFAVIILLIMLIIAAVRDKPKKYITAALAVSFTVFTVCVFRSVGMILVVLGFVFGLSAAGVCISALMKNREKKIIAVHAVISVLSVIAIVTGFMLFANEYEEGKNAAPAFISAGYGSSSILS